MDEPDQTECRLVVKMLYDQGTLYCILYHHASYSNQWLGIKKTYKLTYEAATVMHALFDKRAARSQWRASSRMLREYNDFFGPRTEQLDLYSEDGRITFTSFTGKVVDGKGKDEDDTLTYIL